MLASQYLYGVLRRPFVRIIVLCLFIIFLFATLLPHTDPPGFFDLVPPQDQLSHIPHRPMGPPRHRIKAQRPLAGPMAAHDGPWAERADAVRGAFLHAYQGYLTHAAPHDELKPIAKLPVDNFNGWGLSIVDSLDTMWLMGLYDEFDAGLAVVANVNFTMPPSKYAPFFETVIRYLGGLLSAYALSQDPILLARADDLGTALLPAFDTSSGLPMYAVNTVNGKVAKGWAGGAGFAESLTCQLEYKYLAYLTGRKVYYDAVERVMDLMYEANVTSTGELFPLFWSIENGTPIGRSVSIGSSGDSAYEYMLKQWLLTGRTDTKARDLYIRSVDAILDHLTYLTPNRSLLYVTDATVDIQGNFLPSHKLEHLTCFLPATLALGAATLPNVPQRHMWAARALAHTCWVLYADSPSGLAPDVVLMRSPQQGLASPSPFGRPWVAHLKEWEQSGSHGDPPGVRSPESVRDTDTAPEYAPVANCYLLRPETVESFYLLWRTTGDEMWRERGWEVFEALEREARVEGGGYASVENVHHIGGSKIDSMPSWFLAETLKYLFLLFTDEDLVPLDRWVLNTEAHPLPVFHWSVWEMERLGITRGIKTGRDTPSL
ncbi:seven-hairpin glycosidase [Lactarius pseudohatsudake]|nr:seven-hairpin glycosidase [Lactarius pseudohatsudake]